MCRVSGFVDSDFAPVLHSLVEAYKEKEEDAFNKCCDDSIFRTMDNEVRKICDYCVPIIPGIVMYLIYNHLI